MLPDEESEDRVGVIPGEEDEGEDLVGEVDQEWTSEDEELLALLEQLEREKVSPRFEEWRKPYAYKIAFGGRGAGAKTESAFSLAVQFCEVPDYFGDRVNVLITREVQSTIDLSSYEAVVKKVRALGYKEWAVGKKTITNKKNGSRFTFRGLSDLTADNFRSLQDVDILIVEEAHGIGYKAWNTVLPSMRKAGCEVWVLFNRVEDIDPCYDLFVMNERPRSCVLDLKPGNIDNPWFDQSELPEKRAADYARDPEEAGHIWEGLPRMAGHRAVMPLALVRAAIGREVPDGGEIELGVDVARFGDDKTVLVKRKGLKVVEIKKLVKADTQEVARVAWDMVGRDPKIAIKVDDSGVGCITGRTKVLTPAGWIEATELKEGGLIYSRGDSGICVETIKSVKRWENTRVLSRGGFEFSFSHVLPYRTRVEYPEKQTAWEIILEKSYPYLSKQFDWDEPSEDFVLGGHVITMPHGGMKRIRSEMVIDGKAFSAFLGWFVSEGHVYKGDVVITQKKPEHLEEIESLMSIFGSRVIRKKGSFLISNVTLAKWLVENCYKGGTGFRYVTVPRFVANNSRENIDAFLDAFMKGDGYIHKGERMYCTSSKWLVDDLVELTAKVGITTSVTLRYKAGSKAMVQGREITRVYDHFLIAELSDGQNRGTRPICKGPVETSFEDVYELSITGESKLFLTMCQNKQPVWTHNGGVTDKLKDLGANVIPVNFGSVPSENMKTKYTTAADEMWFEFPLAEASIPDDMELIQELSTRQFKYTNKDQRKIESKDDFKKRIGRSPDAADGTLLAFYRPQVKTFAFSL